MKLQARHLGVALVFVAGILAARAGFGQTAEVPFFAQEFERPNVMIFLDTSGNMNSNIDHRKKFHILRDVVGGSGNPITVGGLPLYVDHSVDHFGATIAEVLEAATTMSVITYAKFDLLTADLDAKLLHIIRLEYDDIDSVYRPLPQGEFFSFISASDRLLDVSNPFYNSTSGNLYVDVTQAITTFDALMREKWYDELGNDNFQSIQLVNVAGTVKTLANTTVGKIILTPSDAASASCVQSAGCFEYMVIYGAFYRYEDNNSIYLPGQSVMRVLSTASDKNYVWTTTPVAPKPPDPATFIPAKGICYKTGNNQFSACYRPINLNSTDTAWSWVSAADISYWWEPEGQWLIWNDPVGVPPQEMVNRVEDFELFRERYRLAKGLSAKPLYKCPVNAAAELMGDAPYTMWSFDTGSPHSLLVDGNATTRQIWRFCNSTDTGAVGIVDVDEAMLRADIIAGIPKVTSGITWTSSDGSITLSGFQKTTTGTRLDTYLGATGEIYFHDPFFGGYFDGMMYDQAFSKLPGLMDLYPLVNYGFIKFDVDDEHDPCEDSDFPLTSEDACQGGMIHENLTSWADFPAYYPNSSVAQNRIVQNSLTDLDVKAISNSPIGDALQSFWYYFYGPEETSAYGPHHVHYPWDGGTLSDGDLSCDGDFTDSKFSGGFPLEPTWTDTRLTSINTFDLGFPNPKGENHDHIVQDDPFYQNKCRRNYIIFLTGGQQTGGAKQSSPCQDNHAKILDMENYWVYRLMYPPHDPLGRRGDDRDPWGVKTFFVAFMDGINDIAHTELKYMGLTSKWYDESGQPFPFEEKMEDYSPYYRTNGYLPADSETSLRQTLGAVMDAIMKGSFARTAPEVATFESGTLAANTTSSGVILTSYYDIGLYQLWSGHLIGWKLPDFTNPDYEPLWADTSDLAVHLNEQPDDERYVFTALNESSSPMTMVEYESSLASTLQSTEYFYHYFAGNTQYTGHGAEIIDLARGKEGATFADGSTLEWKLGPITRSRTRIIEQPGNFELTPFPYYNDFVDSGAVAGRIPMIVFGTGHGFLHFFDLDTANEIFAFVPKPVIKAQPYLWTANQINGIDSSIWVDDVWGPFSHSITGEPSYGSSADGNKWRSVLISGLGEGGTAYFALDITRMSDAYDASGGGDVRALWYFRDPRLGKTHSIPVTGMIRYGTTGSWVKRSAAFFGGGFAPNPGTPDVGGYFFILDPATGDTIKVIELPDADGGANTNQVPGAPVILDMNSDGYYDQAYVGDMAGQVWKINFASPDPDDWEACLFFDSSDIDSDGSYPDSGAIRKPIWYTPSLAYGPDGNLLVYIATGHIELRAAAMNEEYANNLFAVVDDQSWDSCEYASNIQDVYSQVPDASATEGWPITFEVGEKLISTPIVVEGRVVFKTYRPEIVEACSPGSLRLWMVDYLTGRGLFDDDGTRSEDTEGTSDIAITPSGAFVGTCTQNCSCAEGVITVGCPQDEGQIPIKGAWPLSWCEGCQFP